MKELAVPDSIVSVLDGMDFSDMSAESSIPDISVAKDETSFDALSSVEGDRETGNNCMRYIRISPRDQTYIERALGEIYPNYSVSMSGQFMYPEGGYMAWHTNSNARGKRIYLNKSDEANKSFFRYSINGKKGTIWDSTEWSMKEFEINSDRLWHCVYAGKPRLSLGFRLIKNLR